MDSTTTGIESDGTLNTMSGHNHGNGIRRPLCLLALAQLLLSITACTSDLGERNTTGADNSEGFTFVVISDALRGPAPIYAKIAALDPRPAFVLQIGDLGHDNPARKIDRYTEPIEAWRDFYERILSASPHAQDFRKYITPNFPLYHIWDDHDYGDNDANGTAPWKEISKQAFMEFFPMPFANPEDGLYFTFRHGPAQFFVLDTRYQRDPQDLPDGPQKSMLGESQKEWLFRELRTSTATWKFIISSVPWNPTVAKDDSWDIYLQEREEIASFIQENNVGGILFISGDIHSGGAIDDGTNATFPEVSVPHTNSTHGGTCTADSCGIWSAGFLLERRINGGFALITVGLEEVVLSTWGLFDDGSLRKTLELRVEK